MTKALCTTVNCEYDGSLKFALNGNTIMQTNLVLDAFPNRFVFQSVLSVFLAMGTGSTPATGSDTALETAVAKEKTAYTTQKVSRIDGGFQWIFNFRFDPGKFDGQLLTECGLSVANNKTESERLITRALLSSPLVVGATDYLDVEYTIQMKYVLPELGKKVTYDGVEYTFNLQPSTATSITKTNGEALTKYSLSDVWYLGADQISCAYDEESHVCTLGHVLNTTPTHALTFSSAKFEARSVEFFTLECTPSLTIPSEIPAQLDIVVTIQY